MKSTLFLLVTLLFWHSQAVAGFEWIPPKNDPTVQKPAAPLTKTPADFSKDKRDRTNKAAKQSLTPAERLERIFDYEAARISSMKQQDALQAAQNKVEQQKDRFLSADSPGLNETIVKNTGLIPFKQSIQAAAVQGYAPSLPQGQLLADLSIDSTEKPIVGFGAQVPLALAVSDIVPDHYSFAFEGGVNPGLLVSWEGLYRPWTIVLSEMLAMRGLSAVIDKKQIKIFMDPTRPAVAPMPLGAAYATQNFSAGGLQINPMPAPQNLTYNSTAAQLQMNAPPLLPVKSLVPATKAEAKAAQQTPKTLHISSFPLQEQTPKAATTHPAPSAATPISLHRSMTPVAQDKTSLVMAPPSAQKAPASAAHKTTPEKSVYIPRHEAAQKDETTLDKISDFFASFTRGDGAK